MKEALFYSKLPGKKVKCGLCPHKCTIAPGKRGICRVRENMDGKLVSLVYGKLSAYHIDPIEKKPLFHFAPGSPVLSIATVGCNLRCEFCQNFEISMTDKIFGEDFEPDYIVNKAIENGVQGIAYTYTEPTIFYEFALDVMKLAKKKGLYNVWVSNGYINPEPARKAARYLDAINVDLKGDMRFYRKLCKVPGEEPMHKALRIYKKAGVWIEIANLMIEGYNSRKQQIEGLVTWIKRNLGTDTPIHFNRFRPYYKFVDVDPTRPQTLEAARKIAIDMGMKWAYVGNVPGNPYESTHCPKCGEILIERVGFELLSYSDKCKCGGKVPIKGKKWSGVKGIE